MKADNTQVPELSEAGNVTMTDHLLIRDVDTGEILVDQKDTATNQQELDE